MAVDLSKLSDDDLAALEAGDLTRVSDAGLDILSGGAADEVPMAAPVAQPAAQPAAAPAMPAPQFKTARVYLPGTNIPLDVPEQTLQQILGAGEAGLSMLTGATTGALASVPGFAAGITQAIQSGKFGTQEAADLVQQATERGMERFTYQPRTQAGQRALQAVGEAIAPAVPMLTGIGGITAGMQPQMAAVGQSVQTGGRIARGAVRGGLPDTVPVAGRPAAQWGQATQQQAGPAGRGMDAGAAVTPEAERRLVTAEGLPVPVQLTRGAATREAGELAFEKETMRLPQGARLRQRAEENNLQALQNFDALIDMSEAQTPPIGPQATGRSVRSALLEGYERAKARTRAAYAEARNSPGADEVVDFNAQVQVGAEQPLSVFEYLSGRPNIPSEQVATAAKTFAQRLGFAAVDEDGGFVQTRPITVRDAEQWRREINQAIGLDPTQMRQGAILKSAIDDTVGDTGGDLYRRARALRRQQANLFENRASVASLIEKDPGGPEYKVALDQIVQRSIFNGAPEEIRNLSRIIRASGPRGQQAWKEMQGGVVARIRDRSTSTVQTTAGDEKVISPAALNKEIEALDRNGRLDVVFGPQRAQTLRDLNEVVRYMNTVPPGTLINNSGTAATLMQAMAETAESTGARLLPGPLKTAMELWAKASADRKLQQRVDRALNPRKRD